MSRIKKSFWTILFLGLSLSIIASCREELSPVFPSARSVGPKSFAVYYGQAPRSLSVVDWAIVQDSYRPISTGKTIYFAYLSLGEIDPETNVAKELSEIPGRLSRVTLSKNRFWHSRVADIRKSSFRQALLRQIDRDVREGFGGIFFDTLDSPLEYREQHPKKGEGIRRAIKSFIETVHVSYPGIRIIVNRGFGVLSELSPSISGVLYEDFCSRFDETSKRYVSVSEEERRSFMGLIAQAKKANPALVVLALDYDDPEHPKFSRSCGHIARKDGLLHYVSDWTLSGSDTSGQD